MTVRPINARAEAWLRSRGISFETAMRSGIWTVSRPAGEPSDSDDADWIAIPYTDRGESGVVNVKYRQMGEKQWAQTKGGAQILYNRPAIGDPGLKGQPLLIVEGELDALAAMEAGYQRVVSVPGGAPGKPGTSTHAYIDEAWSELADVDEFIIATDADGPGCNLRDDLIARLGSARCKTVTFPQGCKDLGDALRLYGVKGVHATLARAKFVPVDGVFTFDDIPEGPPLEPVKLRSLGQDFHNHIGICKGHLSIWTGEANRGKSTLLRNVMWALSRERQWRFAGAFFEDDVRRTFAPAMVRVHAGGQADQEARRKALEWLGENFRFIVPSETEDPTPAWLLDRMETCVRRFGVDFLVVDPWTELDLQLSSGVSETEAVRKYLTAFKRFARRFNVHVAVIAHPRKSPEYGGSKKLPDGGDISGSAHFKNKCDLGVTVQSDGAIDGLTHVRVWKSKYREEMGPTGDFGLLFDANSRRFGYLSGEDRAALTGEAA